MTRILFASILFVLSSSSYVNAQDIANQLIKADSLFQNSQDSLGEVILSKIRPGLLKNDVANKVKYYNLYGGYFLGKGQYRKSISYYENLWDIDSEKQKIALEIAKGINDMGIAYVRLGNRDSAVLAHKKSIKIYKLFDDQQGMAYNYNNLAIIYDGLGLYDSAIAAQKRSMAAAEQIGDSIGLGYGYMGLGVYHGNTDQYALALESMLKSIDIFQSLGDSSRAAMVMMRIYHPYMELHDYDNALKMLHDALIYYKESANNEIVGNIYSKLSIVFRRKGDFEQALTCANTALELLKDVERKRNVVVALRNKGDVFRSMGRYNDAKKFYRMSIELNAGSVRRDEMMGMGHLVLTHLELSELDSAKNLSLYSLDRYGDQIRATTKSYFYRALHLAYKKSQRLDSSLYYLEGLLMLRDSVTSVEKLSDLAKAEYEYQKEKAQTIYEAEKELAATKLEQQRRLVLFLIIIVATISVIIILIIRSYLIKKSANRRLEESNNKIKTLSAFKDSMTGMIAHDLKTPLSIIMNSKESPTTRQMARQMLQLVNNMLDVHRFESTEVKLDTESISLVSVVQRAIDQVQMLASEKNVQLVPDLEEDTWVSVDEELMTRVFVNFFTNAIKFSPPNEEVIIHAVRHDDRISVAISDRGAGIPEDQLAHIFDSFGQVEAKEVGGVGSTGLGLTFCKLALEAHGSAIEVQSNEGEGTTFRFSLQRVASKGSLDKIDLDTIELTAEDTDLIAEYIPKVSNFKLHQAIKIEQELEPLMNCDSKNVRHWTETVINAAYAGNNEHYEELLSLVSQGIK